MTSKRTTQTRDGELHIGLVTPSFSPEVGGLARYNQDLAQGFASLGHLVTVVTLSTPDLATRARADRAGYRLLEVEKETGATRRLRQIAGVHSPVWSARVHSLLRQVHTADPFDVIEFTNWKALGLVHGVRKFAPHVTRASTSLSQLSPHALRDSADTVRRQIALEAAATRRSDLVIVPSRLHWQDLRARYRMYGAIAPPVREVPFGVDLALPLHEPTPRHDDALELLFVGRASMRKGLDVLLRALPEVASRHSGDLRLTVIGADRNELTRGAERVFGLAAVPVDVDYRGRVPDDVLEECYANCDIVVVPSRYESCGLVFLEAMKNGLPVIGCDVGGVRDFVAAGETGLLVAPGDVDELARAIILLASAPELRARLGRQGRRIVQDRFGVEETVRRSLEAYRSLLGPGSATLRPKRRSGDNQPHRSSARRQRAVAIDDLPDAFELLSPLGKCLLGAELPQMRKTIVDYCARRAWAVINYRDFSCWIEHFRSPMQWLVADKLFPVEKLRGSVCRISAHRVWSPSGSRELRVAVDAESMPTDGDTLREVALLDDAAYSGGTAQAICDIYRNAGITLRSVVVGLASEQAIATFEGMGPDLVYKRSVPTDVDILHLRDFVPWLPHSGRATDLGRADEELGSRVSQVRLAPIWYREGEWLHLERDVTLPATLREVSLRLIHGLELHLGRVALARDVALLGPGVAVPTSTPIFDVAPDRPLRELVP